jgi:hypothetical protein
LDDEDRPRLAGLGAPARVEVGDPLEVAEVDYSGSSAGLGKETLKLPRSPERARPSHSSVSGMR